jgi:clan AA aspartic protease
VNARREAIIRLQVRGPLGTVVSLEAVVDTGFSASLSIPATTVSALGLARQTAGEAVLADGTTRQFDIFAAEVEWDGIWRPILVSSIGDEPLVGMRLLAGHHLRIEVAPGGMVEVTPLS